jgi:uncharacterized protein (TIGR02271 family)
MTRTTIVGVFEDQAHAQAAVAELRRVGFREDQIGVISHDRTTTGKTTGDKGTHMAEGAAAGVAAGAGIGALWALGIAAGMLPAIGPVIAGGLLASVLASAAGGAAAAGLIGALIGLGIPEEEARYYEGEFKSGRTLVTIKADGRYDEGLAVVRRHGGYDRTTGRTTTAEQSTGRTTKGGTIKVHEEELQARKHPVETGEVRVRKDVVTEHKTLDVPVTREEVVVERRPASGTASASDIRPGQEIRIPVKEEKVSVEKHPVVTEEVRVAKQQVTETEKVSGTVRKEKVEVEKEGDVNVRGSSSTTDKGKGRK